MTFINDTATCTDFLSTNVLYLQFVWYHYLLYQTSRFDVPLPHNGSSTSDKRDIAELRSTFKIHRWYTDFYHKKQSEVARILRYFTLIFPSFCCRFLFTCCYINLACRYRIELLKDRVICCDSVICSSVEIRTLIRNIQVDYWLGGYGV
jgi:hypothetical protein